jgi:hypothetical protein
MVERFIGAALGLCVLLAGQVHAKENWLPWRGSEGTGAASAKNLSVSTQTIQSDALSVHGGQ